MRRFSLATPNVSESDRKLEDSDVHVARNYITDK